MSSEKFINDMESVMKVVSVIADDLYELSDAFELLGNTHMTQITCGMAMQLHAQCTTLRDILSTRVNSDFKIAQQSSINVLAAATSGVEIERRKRRTQRGDSGEPVYGAGGFPARSEEEIRTRISQLRELEKMERARGELMPANSHDYAASCLEWVLGEGGIK